MDDDSNCNDTATTQVEDKDGHYKQDMDDDENINKNNRSIMTDKQIEKKYVVETIFQQLVLLIHQNTYK